MSDKTQTNVPTAELIDAPGLRVSAYDRLASLLLSLLIMFTAGVFFLCVTWLGSRLVGEQALTQSDPKPVPIKRVGGGTPRGVLGESMELNSPVWQNVEGETDLVNPEVTDTLAQVAQAVSRRRAVISDVALLNPFERNPGGTRQKGTGRISGLGLGEDWPGLPAHVRWELRFGSGNTLETYARQLDFFQLELGIVGGDDTVTVVRDLSRPQPTVEVLPRSARKDVLIMSWRRNSMLREADRELARKAGVSPEGKQIVQFYPEATERLLAALERDYQGVAAGLIKKTIFEIHPDGDGWKVIVVDQVRLTKGANSGFGQRNQLKWPTRPTKMGTI